jgi:chemotaxis family two-component system sensor kinase Cph1
VVAEAVDIVPYYNPSTGAPTPILRSELRSPSEMHLEYLRNMGVAASLSFSIMVRGELWGVLTCHHGQPAFRNVWLRQQGLLMTHMLAAAIGARQETQDVAQKATFKTRKEAFVAELKTYPDLVTGLAHISQSPLAFSEAPGAALVIDKQVFTFGPTPSTAQVLDLVSWLAQYIPDGVYHTRELNRQFSGAVEYQAVASGLLALEMSRYNQEYILFFKPEIKETRIWGGDPQKLTVGPDLRMHPRKSFEKWREIIEGKSQPWLSNEIETAQHFVKELTALRLSHQAEKLVTNARFLAMKNTQLKDLALIMSHNLRAPLVNIQGLHQVYKRKPTLENADFAFGHIADVAANMAQTIADLNNIMQRELQEPLPAEEVRLAELIQKEIQNLEIAITESSAEIQLDLQVPVLKLPKVYLESIIHNFLSNALKYRAPDRRPHITIKTWQNEEWVQLAVADNGVGMNMERVGPKLFGLYNTFHRHEHAKGIGLYLTKLQVESLGGQIAVHSLPNQGTTFTVSFPLD